MRATTIAMFAVTYVLAGEPLDHRWKEDEIDQRRIELRAASGGNRAHRVVDVRASPITTVVRDRVKRVRDGDDACLDRRLPHATCEHVAQRLRLPCIDVPSGLLVDSPSMLSRYEECRRRNYADMRFPATPRRYTLRR